MQICKRSGLIIAFIGIAAVVGCEQQPATPSTPAPPATTDKSGVSSATTMGSSHHGETIDLGTTSAGQYQVRAARDAGDIIAGGDAPIDLWVTGGTAKVVGVRFWIGSQDARGSIKAKAEIESPNQPEHWHTHGEVPDPIPSDSKLWVEIEDEHGTRTLASFDLKI